MKKFFYIFAIAMLVSATSFAQTPAYDLIDLRLLPAPCGPITGSGAIDVAENGVVVYYIECPGGKHFMLWDGTTTWEMTGKPDGNPPSKTNGTSIIVEGSRQGYVWTGGSVTMLNYLPRGINNNGTIVGVNVNDYYSVAVQDGVPITLPPIGLASTATSTNDRGQIVGTIWGGNNVPYLWTNGSTVLFGADLPGPIGSTYMYLNNNGDVAGIYNVPGGSKPFLWDGTQAITLSNIVYGTGPNDLNDSRQVVGESKGFGFLWENGVFSDLTSLIDPALGWHIDNAFGINNQGWIVCTGRVNGEAHGCLLKPGGPTPTTKTTWGRLKSLYR